MDRTFPRQIDSLASVFSFLDETADTYDWPPPVRFAVAMAVEELFTNMVKYNADGKTEISIELTSTDESISVSLVDDDSDPFDITAQKDVDTNAHLKDRRPGGLGIHLVKRFMDEISYEYKERRTRIRVVKHLNG